jgi:hypothetical protein
MKKLFNAFDDSFSSMKEAGMNKNFRLPVALVASLLFLFTSCQKEGTHSDKQTDITILAGKNNKIKTPSITTKVFAQGLNSPRGLKFGPDGNLYVAEGGTGGANSTQCTQVIPPVGPYLGSETGGRISKISPDGTITTVTDQLPSSQTGPLLGNLVSGVADVAFVGNTLYAILAGAGCSHGVQSLPNGIVKVNSDGSFKLVADLSAWQQSHPVANPEEGDFEPDGTWYSMINVNGDLYAVEPNHGEMVKVTTDGEISRVIDISASQGHIVPAALAYHGNFFVGNLDKFPVVAGSANIYKITPSGEIKVWASGFTSVLGLAFDHQERMYVLENSSVSGPGPTPGTGDVIRVNHNGTKETIVSGLTVPTAMTFGLDGKLYISNLGFGAPAGAGEIWQVEINN